MFPQYICCKIPIIVIYTGDVQRSETDSHLDVGCLQFSIEEVFLSELDPRQIEENLTYKINTGIPLSEEEQMQFIILPMIFPGTEDKQSCINRCFALARKLESIELQRFLLSGLLVFTDKVILKQDSEAIWRWLDMTKVGRIFEQEMQKKFQQEKHDSLIAMARRMLEQGLSIEVIQDIVPDLTYDEIASLK